MRAVTIHNDSTPKITTGTKYVGDLLEYGITTLVVVIVARVCPREFHSWSTFADSMYGMLRESQIPIVSIMRKRGEDTL